MCLCLMSGSLLGWFISQRLKMCRVLWWFVFFLFFLQVLSNYIGVRGKQNPCEILFCCKIAWKPECRRLSLTWKTLKRCMLTLSTLFLFWEISLSRISKCVLFFFSFSKKCLSDCCGGIAPSPNQERSQSHGMLPGSCHIPKCHEWGYTVLLRCWTTPRESSRTCPIHRGR